MFVRRLSTVCSIAVETGKRAGNKKLQLRSLGFLEFAVRPRPGSATVDLHLIDAEARLSPVEAEVDGRPVRIEGLTLTKQDFDLAESIGEVDQLSQEGWFRLRFSLTRRHLAFLREAGIELERFPVEIVERGRIDLERGRIVETHAETFELPGDVPADLVRRIGQGGRPAVANSKHPCPVDEVRLVGVVTELFDEGLVKEFQSLGDMIVCPGDRITLGWFIRDANQVVSGHIIEHKSGDTWPLNLPGNSGIGTQDITVTTDGEYQVVINDPSCAPNSARLRVWVVTPGKPIMIAANSTGQGTWAYTAPRYTVGAKVQVTSIRAVDCSWPDAQDPWGTAWSYQFTDDDGRVIFGNVDTTWTGTPRDLPLAGSNWVFEPLATSSYLDRYPYTACFWIRATCA